MATDPTADAGDVGDSRPGPDPDSDGVGSEQEPASPLEFDVPDDETPPAACPYCDRPFESERYATFHVGVRHADECTEAELAAFETERDDEEYDLFTFHVKAAVIILLTYFTFTYFYALVWLG